MSWQYRRLGEVLDVQNGYAFNSKLFAANGEIGLIRIRDIRQGTDTDTRYTGEYDPKYVVHSGDFLIGMDGDFSCYEWRGKPSLLNQRVCRLQDFSEMLLPKFLFYGINKYLKEIEDTTAFTTVKHISSKQIKDILFPVPPISEQKRIVEILDEAFEGIDAAIANTEKNLANTRELFKGYVEGLFVSGKTNWTDVKLGEVAEFKNGLNFTKSSKGEIIKIVGVGDFKDNLWVPTNALTEVQIDHELSASYLLKEGDILTVRSNGNKQLIGRCLLSGPVPEHTSHSGFTIRIRILSKEILPEYLVRYLKSGRSRRRLVESGDGANISSLNQQALAALPVLLPSLAEQKVLVQKIDEVDASSVHLAEIYQRKINTLNELKRSILQKAFRGELTSSDKSLVEVAA